MMDDRGLIFTTDAALALVVAIVLTGSIVAYQLIPQYMGEDHQHLEAMADSALNVMYQEGTLYTAAGDYANGSTAEAEAMLDSNLSVLIPSNIGYRITLANYPSVEDDRNITLRNDVVTKIKVISGPKEGWMGRAWYKLDEVNITEQPQNVTTTLWNFHNWLTNFYSSNNTLWNQNGLNGNYYWGWKSGDPHYAPISFSIPRDATINNAIFLLGSASSQNRGRSYAANVSINGFKHVISNSSFTFLNYRPGYSNRYPIFNYQGNIAASELVAGNNNFFVQFLNVTSSNNMPWFSLIGNYTTYIPLPQGITTQRLDFINAAGLAVPDRQDLGGGQGYGRIYYLNNGTVSTLATKRTIDWDDLLNKNHGYDNGVPFVLTDTPTNDDGSAVSIVRDVYIPPGETLFDGYVVVNAYGGVDNALVEVWDDTNKRWNTIFCSFDSGSKQYSDRSDGYGNIPGILYIRDYLKNGNNKVRITVWDQVGSSDYDLAGLVSCYVSVTYTKLPINWVTFPFSDIYDADKHSYQSNNHQYSQTSYFTIGEDAKRALLFLGVGTDTDRLIVELPDNGTVLYNDTVVPFFLDLGKIDAGGSHIFTNGTPTNYNLTMGNYTVKVTVISSDSWESGDGASNPGKYANAEIFSGTRMAIIYPRLLRNVWTTSYNNTAQGAEVNAMNGLIDLLTKSGINYTYGNMNVTAMYTGDLPNALPVRLELWEK